MLLRVLGGQRQMRKGVKKKPVKHRLRHLEKRSLHAMLKTLVLLQQHLHSHQRSLLNLGRQRSLPFLLLWIQSSSWCLRGR